VSIAQIASIVGGLLLALLWLLFNENIKELFKNWGWTAFLSRFWQRLRPNLHWGNLKGLWWLWLGSGAIGGYALAFGTLWLISLTTSGPQQWLLPSEAIEQFVPKKLIQEERDLEKNSVELPKRLQELNAEIPHAQSPEIDAMREEQKQLQQEYGELNNRLPLVKKEMADYLTTMLSNGALIAQGIPKGSDNIQPVPIRREQWDYLQFDAQNIKLSTAGGNGDSYRGITIGIPKAH
jgi:hypothetical protein